MLAPKLRFKDFNENWRSLKIKDLVNSLDAGISVNSEDIGPLENEYSVLKTSCISTGYFDGNERKRVSHISEIKRLKEPLLNDSILLSRMNTPSLVGMNAYVSKAPINTFLPDRLWQLKINKNNTITQWLAFYLGASRSLNKIQDLASGTSNSMKNITKPDVFNLDIFVPSKKEQTKIANFLTTLDTRINQQEKQCQLLERYKKGMMQQLFSQELRFKDDDGEEFPEWDIITLGEICNKITLKNKNMEVKTVLTNSAIKGVVRQEDFFDREIASEINLNSYFIINEDDFVYNPRISSTAPVGPVNRSKINIGIMSPLYTVFRFNKGNLGFFEGYFQTSYWHSYMKSIANYGVRFDRMNIKDSDFFKLPIPYPYAKEQTKIANFLTTLDNKITLAKQQLEQLNTYKKGLLQQLFI